MRYRRVLEPGASYFFTLVMHRRARLFDDVAAIDLYRRAVQKVRAKRPFVLEAEVILPDHVHMLWTLPKDDVDYPTRIRPIKTAFTQSILARHAPGERTGSRLTKGEQAVWQRRYWEHLIRDERDFQAHLDYIHFNPVRHGRVAAARDWPHSTFREWVERGTYDEWWGSEATPSFPKWVGME